MNFDLEHEFDIDEARLELEREGYSIVETTGNRRSLSYTNIKEIVSLKGLKDTPRNFVRTKEQFISDKADFSSVVIKKEGRVVGYSSVSKPRRLYPSADFNWLNTYLGESYITENMAERHDIAVGYGVGVDEMHRGKNLAAIMYAEQLEILKQVPVSAVYFAATVYKNDETEAFFSMSGIALEKAGIYGDTQAPVDLVYGAPGVLDEPIGYDVEGATEYGIKIYKWTNPDQLDQ